MQWGVPRIFRNPNSRNLHIPIFPTPMVKGSKGMVLREFQYKLKITGFWFFRGASYIQAIF